MTGHALGRNLNLEVFMNQRFQSLWFPLLASASSINKLSSLDCSWAANILLYSWFVRRMSQSRLFSTNLRSIVAFQCDQLFEQHLNIAFEWTARLNYSYLPPVIETTERNTLSKLPLQLVYPWLSILLIFFFVKIFTVIFRCRKESWKIITEFV